jgi:hypothetical protein
MSKMNLHDSFEYLQHKLWPKERLGSKCQFDSLPLKAKNCLKFRVCRRRAIYCWKTLDEIYNFVSNLTSTEGLHKKLWASKVAIIPILGTMGLSTWESQEKCHLGVALW